MEELLGRQPPHSAPAEQAVIGAMLIDPSCIPDVIEKVKSDEFYIQANRDIFDTIFAMFSYGQSVDAVTVLEQMKVRGVYKDTTQQYLMEVMQITPTAANVLKYAAIVRDQALLRNLHTAADEINNMIFEGSGGADAMLEAAERKIYALRQGRNVGGLQPISMVIQRVYANLSEAASSGGGIPGLATGLPDLDQTILGLNAGELILIAARPGMGKTSLALNIALYVGKTSGKTVAVFSLEMAREQLTTRLLAGEGLVDSQKLLTGKLSADEWRRVGAAATTISATDIRIDDNPTLTVSDMNAQCRRVPNLDLVVIDYLQLMQSAGSGHSWSNESRTQAVSDISRMLKIMAKELNVPVICLSQLSRANESRQDKRPMLSDLRESGAIEQDADIVLFLYRDDYYNSDSEKRNVAECTRLGIQYGVYWYSYASTPAEARQEARCCLAAIKGKHLCLPVAYDIEYEPCILRLTNAQRTALVQAFLSEIEAAGYYGILYASCNFIRNRLDYKALSKYDIWVAQYGSTCTCPLPYGIWQYSSRNALGVPGYGTSLDCNRVYKDYEQLMIQAGLQGHTAPTPEDTTPNKLDKQRITIGRISSGDRATIRALCEGLGLISAGLYRETCADGNQWMLDVGPVSSGDAWYIMRKCAELQLIDAGLYKAEYVG